MRDAVEEIWKWWVEGILLLLVPFLYQNECCLYL